MKTIDQIQDIFSTTEDDLIDLHLNMFHKNQALAEKIDAFVVAETERAMDRIAKPWHDFNEGIIQHFKALNGKNIAAEKRQDYLKAALEYIAPNNVVKLLDSLFHSKQFDVIQKRYENNFNALLNNPFAKLIERYKIPAEKFHFFSAFLLENSQELTSLIKNYYEAYVHLLGVLKNSGENDDELFIFGAGALGALLAGPIGGLATRSVLKSTNSKEAKINGAIGNIYDRLERIHNKVSAILMTVHKNLLYVNYSIYVGLLQRLADDLSHIGYVIEDVDFEARTIAFSLTDEKTEEISSWYYSIQKEIGEHVKNQNYQEADIISQHLLQFFVNNPFAKQINKGDFPIGYRAAVLRYAVLTNWFEYLQNNKIPSEEVYNLYSKLLQDFNLGINNLEEIEGIRVPAMIETVLQFIHITEILCKQSPGKSFQLRINTLHILLEYITNFSEKALNESTFSFPNEYIDKETLELISCYQLFLKSINMTTVTNIYVKKAVAAVNFRRILTFYQNYATSSLETQFYQFLQQNERQVVGNQENRAITIRQSESSDGKQKMHSDKNITAVQTVGMCAYYEQVYHGEIEDTDEARERWFTEYNKKVDFRLRLFLAEKNDVDSQYLVGLMYYSGNGTTKNDEEAYRWILKAAKQNHVKAIEMLLTLYYEGKVVKRIPKEELKWYLKLEEELNNNNPQNQLILGSMYFDGYGTAVDYDKAFEWFAKAAEQGNIDAYYELGKIYEQGLGRLKNIAEAKRWYEKAANKNHEKAQLRLEEIRKEEQKATRIKLAKKASLVAAASVLLISLYVGIEKIMFQARQKEQYEMAQQLLADGKYEEARREFMSTIGYKDSRTILQQWDNSFGLAAGGDHTVGIKKDGTVVATGVNDGGELNIEDWENITAVAISNAMPSVDSHTVGLKADGTVVAAGLNHYGQLNVDDWNDIIAIAAGTGHTVGLKADGSVVAVGNNYQSQLNVDDWNKIIAIAAGDRHTVGLKADGTVVAVGSNSYGQLKVSRWKNIVAIAAGDEFTVGLKADGTVVLAGDDYYGTINVKKWKDIIAISARNKLIAGLKKNGSVVFTGDNFYEKLNVDDWENIVGIATGLQHIVGLKEDGTVVATGDNNNGQLNVENWTDLLMPTYLGE